MQIVSYYGWSGDTPPTKNRYDLWKDGVAPGVLIIQDAKDRLYWLQMATTVGMVGQHSVTLNVGTSFCHPADDFCKKTGRKVAEANIKPVEFTVLGIYSYPEKVRVNLRSELGDISILFDKGRIRPEIERCDSFDGMIFFQR